MKDKKDLGQAAADAGDMFNMIAQGSVGTAKKDHIPPSREYRFNLAMPPSFRTYLQQRAYECSSPVHQCTVTEYLLGLIRADMKKNKWTGQGDDDGQG